MYNSWIFVFLFQRKIQKIFAKRCRPSKKKATRGSGSLKFNRLKKYLCVAQEKYGRRLYSIAMVCANCFCSSAVNLGSVMVRMPLSTLAPMASFFTFSGSVSICLNCVVLNSRRRK